MTLRTAYAATFATTLWLGMLAVLLGGEMPVVCWLALLWPLRAAVRLLKDSRPGSLPIGTAMAAGGIIWGVSIVAVNGLGYFLLGAAVALLVSVCARLEARAHLGHDLQALLLSLLLVLAGSGLNTGLSFGVMFVLYALAAAWALATRQLWIGAEREAARERGAPMAVSLSRRDIVTPRFVSMTTGTATLVLLSTTVLFTLFPRVGLGSLAFLQGERGRLAQDVRLDGSPRGLGGGRVMARVTGIPYSAFARGLYLRTDSYDFLSMVGFSRSTEAEATRAEEMPIAGDGDILRYEVFLQPVTGSKLGTLGPVMRARVIAGGTANPSLPARIVTAGPSGQTWSTAALTGPIRYQIAGQLTARVPSPDWAVLRPLPDAQRRRYLQLPTTLDARVRAHALALTAGAATDADRVRAIALDLERNYEYSLTQTNNEKADPLASFLFDDRRGHCEYFAAALAALLRASGVPARTAVGFAGGWWDEEGEVIVFTAADAHAWVEWYDPEHGWLLADATPAGAGGTRVLSGLAALYERLLRAWDDNVLDYGLDAQMALLQRAADLLPSNPQKKPSIALQQILIVGVVLAGAVVMAWWLSRHLRQRRRESAVAPLARAIERACRRLLGRAVEDDETLRAAVSVARGRLGAEAAELLAQALAVYEGARFGEERVKGERLAGMVREVARLRPVHDGHGAAEREAAGRDAAAADHLSPER